MTLIVSNINLTTAGTTQVFANTTANSLVIRVAGNSHSLNTSGIFTGSETVNSVGVFKSGVQIQPLPVDYDVGEYIIVDSTTPQPANSLSLNTTYTKSSYPTLVAKIGAPYIDQTWTQRTSSNSAMYYLTGVAYGNGTFVVIGNDGSVTGVMTSPTGVTWTNRSTANTNIMQLIKWGPELGIFVAVGEGGAVMSSSNGTVWTNRNNGVNPSHYYARLEYGNSAFIAFDYFSNAYITSTTGTTWTTRTIPDSNPNIQGVAYGNGRFVAVGYRNDPNLGQAPASYTSTDKGVTWTPTFLSDYFTNISYINGLFYAFSQRKFFATSPDGINWSSTKIVSDFINTPDHKVVVVNNIMAMMFGKSDEIYYTYDGSDWSRQRMPDQVTGITMAYGNSVYTMIGDLSGGAIYTSPLTSYNSNTQFKLPPLNSLLSGRIAYVRY